MYDKKEILQLLENGASIDEIADGMASLLNECQEDWVTIQKEREEKAKAEELQEEGKKMALRTAINALADYCTLCDVDAEVIKALRNADNEELETYMKQFDALLELATKTKTLEFKFPNWGSLFFS